jgi:hypothetical protein
VESPPRETGPPLGAHKHTTHGEESAQTEGRGKRRQRAGGGQAARLCVQGRGGGASSQIVCSREGGARQIVYERKTQPKEPTHTQRRNIGAHTIISYQRLLAYHVFPRRRFAPPPHTPRPMQLTRCPRTARTPHCVRARAAAECPVAGAAMEPRHHCRRCQNCRPPPSPRPRPTRPWTFAAAVAHRCRRWGTQRAPRIRRITTGWAAGQPRSRQPSRRRGCPGCPRETGVRSRCRAATSRRFPPGRRTRRRCRCRRTRHRRTRCRYRCCPRCQCRLPAGCARRRWQGLRGETQTWTSRPRPRTSRGVSPPASGGMGEGWERIRRARDRGGGEREKGGGGAGNGSGRAAGAGSTRTSTCVRAGRGCKGATQRRRPALNPAHTYTA